MSAERKKRPPLERDRPIRTWSTLFRPPDRVAPGSADGRPAGDGSSAARPSPGPSLADAVGFGGPLADTVEKGYRVIDEYIRQGQTFAQGFSPTSWMNPGQQAAPADMQQLAQRVMQYGWDFAGLWFEMWTKMAGSSSGWPAPFGSAAGAPPGAPSGTPPTGWPFGTPPPGPFGPFPKPSAEPVRTQNGNATAHPQDQVEKAARMAVSVASKRPTTTTLDLRPGPTKSLVVHALRAEGTSAPPIREVTMECSPDQDSVIVKVAVPPDQPAGIYNAMIIDSESNLPRGTLSLTISSDNEG